MARILVTGSSDGLGLMAARLLVDHGHEVLAHARNDARAAETRQALPGAAAVLVGDLSSIEETRHLAAAAGACDAVINNAGVGYQERRRVTADGLEHVFAINVLAPYLLTALMPRPQRLVYLSSGMHRGGHADLTDPQWERRRWEAPQAYSDSKLFDVTLALAVARRRPDVLSNAVEPGWVPTNMGGPGAPDDLDQGHRTQVWLAEATDPAARVSGELFYHLSSRPPHPAAADPKFQDELLAYCASVTDVGLPETTLNG
jgi:NAD(P)-dependent dehydrogenase (short-subunit alcohol dehydrogenase family)